MIVKRFELKLLAATISALLASSVTMAKDDGSLEVIVVTSQKRSENMQDVTVAVSAISADELDELNLFDTTEIAAQIPNM